MELSDQIEWCEITYQTHNEIVMMMGNDFMVMDRINHGANLSFSPPCFSMIEMISLQLQRDQKLQTKIRNPSFPKLPKRIMRHYTKCMFKVNCFHVKHTKFVSNFSIPWCNVSFVMADRLCFTRIHTSVLPSHHSLKKHTTCTIFNKTNKILIA